jgi:hypothetical protein
MERPCWILASSFWDLLVVTKGEEIAILGYLLLVQNKTRVDVGKREDMKL